MFNSPLDDILDTGRSLTLTVARASPSDAHWRAKIINQSQWEVCPPRAWMSVHCGCCSFTIILTTDNWCRYRFSYYLYAAVFFPAYLLPLFDRCSYPLFLPLVKTTKVHSLEMTGNRSNSSAFFLMTSSCWHHSQRHHQEVPEATVQIYFFFIIEYAILG